MNGLWVRYYGDETKPLGSGKPTIRVPRPFLELLYRVADRKAAPLQLDRDNVHHPVSIADEQIITPGSVADPQRLTIHIDNDIRLRHPA